MTVRRLALAVVLALLAAPASAASLEGHWWGEGFQPALGVMNQWLLHLKPDGTYDIEFRTYERCVVKQRSQQSGRWERDGDRYRTVTEVHNGKPVENKDQTRRQEYAISRLDEQMMEYRHTETDQTYRSFRVPAGYTFPRCLESS